MPAPTTLSELLSPLPEQEFFKSFWGRDYCLVRGGAEKFKELFSWEVLNKILFQHRFDFPRIRLLKNGEVVAANYYIKYRLGRGGMKIPLLQEKKLAAELAKGAVVSLTSLEDSHQPITILVKNLRLDLCANIVVNVYAGLKNSKGLGVHWDDHDVIIAHISGRKKWNVYGATQSYPVRPETVRNPRPPDSPMFEVVVEEGDLLYIPRGWWHSAEAQDVPTLHLTLGVTNGTGLHFLSWLSSELRASEVYRKDLPVFSSFDEQKRHMDYLRAELLRLWTDDILERYLEAYKATLVNTNPFRLPQIL